MTAVPGKNCVVSELIRAAFARDGYVVIPSLLNDDELSSMRGESHRLLKRQRLLGAQVEQNGCIAEPLDPARLSDEQRTQLNEYRCVHLRWSIRLLTHLYALDTLSPPLRSALCRQQCTSRSRGPIIQCHRAVLMESSTRSSAAQQQPTLAHDHSNVYTFS